MCKKNLFIFPIIMALLIIPFGTAYAAQDPSISRLAGSDRYQTACKIANTGWQQSDYAILAYGGNYPDALAAAPLANKLNAPLLLTNKDSINSDTSKTLKDLQVKTVYLIGGTGVISENEATQLTNAGYTVKRIAGQDRYETSIKIAEELGSTNEVVLTTGKDYADALSIGPIAAQKQMPIILVPQDNVTNSIQAFINSKTINQTYVIGDETIISDNVANKFSNPVRITGTDKYERNVAILDKFWDDYDHTQLCLATGENFADALAGGAFAAKSNGVVVLVKNDLQISTSDFLNENTSQDYELSKYIVFGGESAVSSSLLNNILSCTRIYSDKLDWGTLTGQTYTNSYFNMTLSVPASWIFYDGMKETQEYAANNPSDSVNASSTDASNFDVIYLLDTGNNDSWSKEFILEAFYMRGDMTSKDYLLSFKKNNTDFTYSKDIYVEKVGGVKFNVLEFKNTNSNGTSYVKYYAAVLKGYLVEFHIYYTPQAGISGLDDTLSSVKFTL